MPKELIFTAYKVYSPEFLLSSNMRGPPPHLLLTLKVAYLQLYFSANWSIYSLVLMCPFQCLVTIRDVIIIHQGILGCLHFIKNGL